MLDFHRELLDDSVRTLAYRDAIRSVVKSGDIVLDLGCGTGILSFFAVEAGAGHVYAIEAEDVADAAELLVRQRGMSSRITVLHDVSTRVTLPARADVLVTETLGPTAFEEGVLGSLLDARTRLLRPDARIIPERIELRAVPVELPGLYGERVEWWDVPRFGIDVSPMRFFAANTKYGCWIDESAFLAAEAAVIDIGTRSFADRTVMGNAVFHAARSGIVHGFAVWFFAALADGITLENRGRTHPNWMQGFFPLPAPVRVEVGAAITLSLETDNGRAWRWRGEAAGVPFDQTTLLRKPLCSHR